MSVDGELLGGVAGPDLVDIFLVVIVEEGGIEGDAVIRAESAEVTAGRVADDERGPVSVVGSGLSGQTLADSVEAVGCHA